VLTGALLAFLWRIERLSASFGVLGGRGSGSPSTRSRAAAAERVSKQQHSMQETDCGLALLYR
jgi:hypothetical protein